MKEIKTCEEYVIMELEEKREQVKRLTEACRNYIEVMDDVNTFLDIMKKRLNLHRAADGKEIITMGYIFEEYEPDEFKFLKELFHLEGKGEEKHE
jgi:tetrahydromethanopterin S-methyltransferase subunit B